MYLKVEDLFWHFLFQGKREGFFQGCSVHLKVFYIIVFLCLEGKCVNFVSRTFIYFQSLY